jgi:hypothetical protein
VVFLIFQQDKPTTTTWHRATNPYHPLCKHTAPSSSTYFAPVTMLRKLTTLFILLRGEVERRESGWNLKRETSVEFWCRGKSDDVRKIMPGAASKCEPLQLPDRESRIWANQQLWAHYVEKIAALLTRFKRLSISMGYTQSEKLTVAQLLRKFPSCPRIIRVVARARPSRLKN